MINSPYIKVGHRGQYLFETRAWTDNEKKRFIEIELYYMLKAIHDAFNGTYVVSQFLQTFCDASNTPYELIEKYYTHMRRGRFRPKQYERILYGLSKKFTLYKINRYLKVDDDALKQTINEFYATDQPKDQIISLLSDKDAEQLSAFLDGVKQLTNKTRTWI